jgi:hypothetical protein
MTICKACGREISVAYPGKHFCPTPNAAYETERDKYRKAEVDRRARNEALGIAEVPSAPVWVELEVFLISGRVLRYITLRDNFEYESGRGRLVIESARKGDWSARVLTSHIESYRFREFADEAAALIAATHASDVKE